MVDRLLHRLRKEMGEPAEASAPAAAASARGSLASAAWAAGARASGSHARAGAEFLPRMRFVSEQSGEVETYLKGVWSAYFNSRRDVFSAYLVRVRMREDEASTVALCLRAGAADRQTLVERVSQVFREMFHPEEALSLIFLTEAEEAVLRSVAQPFYESQGFAALSATAAEMGGLSFPHAPHGSSLEAARLFRAGDDVPLRSAG